MSSEVFFNLNILVYNILNNIIILGTIATGSLANCTVQPNIRLLPGSHPPTHLVPSSKPFSDGLYTWPMFCRLSVPDSLTV